MTSLRVALAAFCLAAIAGASAAQQPPSYARQVRPFLARYCLECHSGKEAKGDLDLETFKGLMRGGQNGPVVLPGEPDRSRLVLLAEGKDKPKMPPKKARQPKPAEVAVLRAWVAAGAKDDSASVGVTLPDLRPRVPVAAPVTALAYRPDGKLLAAGGQKAVTFIDPAKGDVTGRLGGLVGRVTGVAFSPDGKRFAVAAGQPGSPGEVRLYAVGANGLPDAKPLHTLSGHKDAVLDLAFSPDGKLLATAGYDRLVKLWDVAAGKAVRDLKDHSDAVYGVAFSPDGKLLASGAADRAVKVWDAATGGRLLTLGDATDWVYAVAWSPDGKHLAGAGVDRSIRVWQVRPDEARLVHAVFAHERSVLRLAYAADGKTLFSLGEDRAVKAWETGRMTEKNVYPRQAEAVLALAVRPDQKRLAVGRYDGVLSLLDAETGKVQATPLPAKPKPPQATKITPNSGQRGKTVRVTVEGKALDDVSELTANQPGVMAKVVAEGRSAGSVQFDVTFPPTTPAGVYPLTVKGPGGASAPVSFTVDLFTAAAEQEPNDSPHTGQKVALPATVVGALGRAGDVDWYRFEAKPGQQVGVQALTAAVGSKMDPVLTLIDPAGRVVAESTNGVLGHVCEKAGVYALGIRDREYRGGGNMHYRLHVGEVPVVTSIFPLGLQRGTEAEIHLDGVFLGSAKSVRVKAPADAAPGTRLPFTVQTPLGPALGGPAVVVGEFAEVARPVPIQAIDKATSMDTPGTANGRIDRPGSFDLWRFSAKKGTRLLLEVSARRIGSPLDSRIELLDVKGRPVPRAVLRGVAKTYVTFRDHDSVGAGIRLETWNELAVNDYLLVGDELLRIRQLPRNPDDDCQFFSAKGQRIGWLGTTPTHHALGTPMYKVTLHPPGTTFPPNGLPVVTLNYANDDGGPGFGKDSRLFFDPPADGDYLVRVSDARGEGGLNHAYRLTVRPPRPNFTVSFSPTSPAVWKGGAVPVSVTADRTDGFDGEIAVKLENVPPGFHAPATTIPAGENSTAFALSAEPNAAAPPSPHPLPPGRGGEGGVRGGKVPPLKLVARAMIDGKEVVREAAGGVPKVMEPGDLATTTEQSEVTVRPGGEVRLTVRIERRGGFKGRVPLDVRGLPHGVRVLDIGLNGILVTPQESSRTIVIYCEPWVKPTEHAFVVLSRSERKGTEHAAKSVLLKVVK